MLMQQIWKDGTDWDETIKPTTLKQWTDFLDDYPAIDQIKIPRYLNYHPSFSVEIHGFCDASEKAYAAALYIRCESPEGQIFTSLLASKTKVAPLKFITLPRKELCGAELLARLFKHFKTQFPLTDYGVSMWTDSTIVLAWLQKPPYHWNTFIANRTASILDKVGANVWSHIDSKDNPADVASRGSTASDLVNNELWWHGPNWLKLPHESWPLTKNCFETSEEIKPIRTHVTTVSHTDILDRFSDLPRAMRVLCYVFRFYHHIHKDHKQNFSFESPLLHQSEIKFVKTRLIILCQRLHLSEYDILSRGSLLPPKSPLLRFNPFVDNFGVLRVNGRLSQSPILSFDEKFPKILPYSGRFTRLYLEMIHRYSIHGANSLMTRLMRTEFWVPKLDKNNNP